MSIGLDIKEALRDSGVKYTIVNTSTSEYLLYETNAQVTKPFIREFFLEAWLPYDTSVKAGDVVEFDKNSVKYLVMHHTEDFVENEVIKYDTVLYKCNVSGEFLRQSVEDGWGSDYKRQTSWQTVATNCYGLQVEELFGGGLEEDEAIALLNIERHEGYFPTSLGIKVGDRYQRASGEYYKVENVINYRFPGCVVVKFGEDMR